MEILWEDKQGSGGPTLSLMRSKTLAWFAMVAPSRVAVSAIDSAMRESLC